MRRIIALAIMSVLTVVGLCAFANSRAADQRVSIDTWQLHLEADIEKMPVLTVADLV